MSSDIYGVDRLPNDHLLFPQNTVYDNNTILYQVVEMDRQGNICWRYQYYENVTFDKLEVAVTWGIHDADNIVNRDSFLITDTKHEVIIEVARNGSIIWQLDPRNYFPDVPLLYGQRYHLNDADRLPNGNTLISINCLNLVVEVNPDGDIVWQYGNPDGLSPLYHQHNSTRLVNNHTTICDSDHDRIIEIDEFGNIVWTTESFPWIHLEFPLSAEKLPDGNTLINDSGNHRDIEITMNGIIVWEYCTDSGTYDADRIDSNAPDLEYIYPTNTTYNSNQIPIKLISEAIDLDKIWLSLHNDKAEEWVFEDLLVENNQTYYINVPDGRYTLFAWANDTYMNSLMLTSDQIPNINQEPLVISFTVGNVNDDEGYRDVNIWIVIGFLSISIPCIALVLLYAIWKHGFTCLPPDGVWRAMAIARWSSKSGNSSVIMK
ncbi:MAG: hypothetical protein ACTSRA_11735 [Promethearchaeota archaeon]